MNQLSQWTFSDTERLTSRWRVLCDFEVQPTTELLRPEATQSKPHTFGPETARVCGAEEDNIHTDPLGRIKVQFPWDRYGPLNQHSSCWVRVSAAWAGNQLGAMHLPRVGQEVIIDFLGGDPDLPICTGRVYNQMNTPPWALPAQQALSGFRSRELNPGGGNSAAGRSNHLVLDDTEQKIQAQLKSDHDHSSLSLGHITRIEDNQGRKDPRGEGFELRTDGHGAIRAQDGLLISTEGRTAAQAHITDMGETTSRLTQAHGQHDSLGDLALQHQAQEATDQGDVAKALEEQNNAIAGKPTPSVRPEPVEGLAQPFPELTEPHLVLASPAGIESTTPQSTHQHSGQHNAITTGGHTSISAGKSLLVVAEKAIRLFAYKAGIRLVSAVAKVDIQALEKSIHFLAKVNITETANRITLSAKEEIFINGRGSYTTFKASGIQDGASGSWVEHAGSHGMPGAKSMAVVVPNIQVTSERRLRALHHDQDPVQGAPFTIEYADADRYSGQLDANSQADLSAAPVGSGRIRMKNDTRSYDVKASERNAEHKGAWTEADFEASLDQASRGDQP